MYVCIIRSNIARLHARQKHAHPKRRNRTHNTNDAAQAYRTEHTHKHTHK